MSNACSCHDISALSHDLRYPRGSEAIVPKRGPAPQLQMIRGSKEGGGCHSNSSKNHSSFWQEGTNFFLFFNLKRLYNLKNIASEGHYAQGKKKKKPFVFQQSFRKHHFLAAHNTITHVQNDDPESSQLMSNPSATRLHAACPAGNTAQHLRSGDKTPTPLPCLLE